MSLGEPLLFAEIASMGTRPRELWLTQSEELDFNINSGSKCCSYCTSHITCMYMHVPCSLTATVVLQHGTLRPGQVLVAGGSWCKVRTMYNERRERIQSAPPSSPVLTTGWKDLPPAGELCLQVCAVSSCVDVPSCMCSEFSVIRPTENSLIKKGTFQM